METLKEKTAKGLFWGAVNNGATQLLNIVIGIFLARLLSPGDYGLVGMLSIFSAIAGNLQSSGFSTAIVNMKSPTARDYNAVFWFNVLTSLAIYAVLFFSAPLIAAYFRQPCLVELSRLVFLSFVIASFGIAHNAYMFKNMMNRELAAIGVVALVASGAAGIAMAYCGMAYWSLAWQQIIYIAMVNIGRYRFTPWRPSLRVDFSPIRRMFPFSVKILVTTIVNTVSNNILTLHLRAALQAQRGGQLLAGIQVELHGLLVRVGHRGTGGAARAGGHRRRCGAREARVPQDDPLHGFPRASRPCWASRWWPTSS